MFAEKILRIKIGEGLRDGFLSELGVGGGQGI